MKEAAQHTPARSWSIRSERAEDAPLVDALVATSFGPGRYAKTAYRLREGTDPEPGLSFVAIEDGILRGSVRFWPIAVGATPALLLGPLAVQSDQRGRGIGIDLMRRGIEAAKAAHWGAIVLVGDAPYYGRVGFVPVRRSRLEFPGPVDPGRILGLALDEGALEALSGPVRRLRLDTPACAAGSGLARTA